MEGTNRPDDNQYQRIDIISARINGQREARPARKDIRGLVIGIKRGNKNSKNKKRRTPPEWRECTVCCLATCEDGPEEKISSGVEKGGLKSRLEADAFALVN